MQTELSFRKIYLILTVSVLCYFLASPIHIYIPAFRLEIMSGLLQYLYVILSAGWIIFSPCGKACENRFFLELLFYLFPTLALLLLVFMQYHPVISILLLVVLIGLTVTFRVLLYREGGARSRRPKVRARQREAAGRLFVILAAALLLVPGVFSVFVYSLESPTVTASEQAAASVSEKTEAYTGLAPELTFLNAFRDEVWDECGAQERVAALERLLQYESEKLGMPPVPLAAARLRPTVLGEFDPADNDIHVDLDMLQEADAKRAMETLLHEAYHAFQFYLIDEIDWEADYTQNAYFNEARSWLENKENYVSGAEDFDAYYEQPLERSARWYSYEESFDLLMALGVFDGGQPESEEQP